MVPRDPPRKPARSLGQRRSELGGRMRMFSVAYFVQIASTPHPEFRFTYSAGVSAGRAYTSTAATVVARDEIIDGESAPPTHRRVHAIDGDHCAAFTPVRAAQQLLRSPAAELSDRHVGKTAKGVRHEQRRPFAHRVAIEAATETGAPPALDSLHQEWNLPSRNNAYRVQLDVCDCELQRDSRRLRCPQHHRDPVRSVANGARLDRVRAGAGVGNRERAISTGSHHRAAAGHTHDRIRERETVGIRHATTNRGPADPNRRRDDSRILVFVPKGSRRALAAARRPGSRTTAVPALDSPVFCTARTWPSPGFGASRGHEMAQRGAYRSTPKRQVRNRSRLIGRPQSARGITPGRSPSPSKDSVP